MRVIEKHVIGALVRSCLQSGYLVGVREEKEAIALAPSSLYQEIMDAAGETSETYLDVYEAPVEEGGEPGQNKGYFRLVHGKDHEVIHDYTFSLDSLLNDADTIAEKYRL